MKKRRTTTRKVIRFRPSLFWDVDPKTIDRKKHSVYIAERIMDFGNDREARWLLQAYSPIWLRRVARKSRVLQPATRALWQKLPIKK